MLGSANAPISASIARKLLGGAISVNLCQVWAAFKDGDEFISGNRSSSTSLHDKVQATDMSATIRVCLNLCKEISGSTITMKIHFVITSGYGGTHSSISQSRYSQALAEAVDGQRSKYIG